MTTELDKLSKAGTMHYLSQLYYGHEAKDRPFITNQLEDQLTAEQIAESWTESRDCFDAILAKRDRSKPVNQHYLEADFGYMYFSEMYSKLDQFNDMLFIKSLELNFDSSILIGFKQCANDSLLESVERILDMLKNKEE